MFKKKTIERKYRILYSNEEMWVVSSLVWITVFLFYKRKKTSPLFWGGRVLKILQLTVNMTRFIHIICLGHFFFTMVKFNRQSKWDVNMKCSVLDRDHWITSSLTGSLEREEKERKRGIWGFFLFNCVQGHLSLLISCLLSSDPQMGFRDSSYSRSHE